MAVVFEPNCSGIFAVEVNGKVIGWLEPSINYGLTVSRKETITAGDFFSIARKIRELRTVNPFQLELAFETALG